MVRAFSFKFVQIYTNLHLIMFNQGRPPIQQNKRPSCLVKIHQTLKLF